MKLASVRLPSLALLLAASLSGCSGATAPGGVGLLSPRVSEAQEIRAGQRAAREASRTLGIVSDQELQDYVQQVGARVAAESERSQLQWTFRVADDPMPNAFGLPGGYVFVTRGMLGVLSSEAELAAVLGHEIAHVNARHGVQALARQSGPELGVWAVPVSELRSLDGGSRVGAGLLFRGHSLEDERQADDLAFKYLLSAGYDVRQMPDVFAALGRLETMGGRSALPPWLASHPDPGERVEGAARRAAGIAEGDSLRHRHVEYLDQIEDLVYGHDPRQGVFRGGTFVHPELQFRIELPGGWRYRNLTQAVLAMTPDGTAALQLSIVEQVGPAEAADRFVAQSGVRAIGDAATDVINGNPAVTVPFLVTTGDGAAEGLASWVSYGGRTYQIVGIATGQEANGPSSALRGTVRSFAPLSDARLPDLRPNEINIVRLGRATTFNDFNRRYPSVVDAEEVALLNRVAGGSSRLRAGARMKRVVKG
jgi:predicted Zn-dependent protease